VLDTVYRIMLDAVSYIKSICIACVAGYKYPVYAALKTPNRELRNKAKDRYGPVANCFSCACVVLRSVQVLAESLKF
jgi:hypothetical protein